MVRYGTGGQRLSLVGVSEIFLRSFTGYIQDVEEKGEWFRVSKLFHEVERSIVNSEGL